MQESRDILALSESERTAIREKINAAWQQRLADIPEQALIWLALVPSWTVLLAENCAFPTEGRGDSSVRALFTRLYREGLCEFTPARPVTGSRGEGGQVVRTTNVGHDRFRLTDAMRDQVLQRVILAPQQGLDRLMAEMRAAGIVILQAQARAVPMPFLVARWATLASVATSTEHVADHFTELTNPLLADRNAVAESTAALNDVQSWIEAARPLEEILGGELTRALAHAARRLELLHRRSYDEQYLTRFLDRAEQIAAFTRLMESRDRPWALHFVGQGGVGKTMLMRYITARYFAERSINASVCRIDFDYLNPDYPSRAPGLLLDQLAQELCLHGDIDTDKEFLRFDNLVVNLHERLGSSTLGARPAREVLVSEEFTELLNSFVGALKSLPQPIIITLDTCEELAKIRPDGTVPENVAATFLILERIHKLLPSLRVVFSGRRPLASAGAGWTCPSSPHPPRPYLLLHEIRGFTHEEGRRYLRERAQVRSDLVDPIVEKSLDRGTSDIFFWQREEDRPANVARHNPFDLALYAAWVLEDETLTAQDIRSSTVDRYIEGRILRRIRHPSVLSLLPAVSLLGHFDREMLREVAQTDEQTFADSFRELTSQEWIQLQQFTFWRVKSGLRERLYAYYRKYKPQALASARQGLIPYLEHITLQWPLAKLNIAHFDAALRLLEADDPQSAAAWWQKVEERFASEGNAYPWAVTLIEQLQGEEGAIALVDAVEAQQGKQESLLRPNVLATYAAALSHARPSVERTTIWTEVVIKAQRHPPLAGDELLQRRALIGGIAANRDRQDPLQIATLLRLLDHLSGQAMDVQLLASLIAALEAIVEYIESHPDHSLFTWEPDPGYTTPLTMETVLAFCDALDPALTSPELFAFALTLAGRICALLKQWARAQSYFDRAIDKLPGIIPGRQLWLDWLAPDDLASRIYLEFVRALYPSALSPQQVLAKIDRRFPMLPPLNTDNDRLASVILLLQRASNLTQDLNWVYSPSYQSASYSPQDRPAFCNAHRSFQPFTLALTETRAALGEVEEAMDILQTISRQAEQSAIDLDTVHAAERVKLRIVRRIRLRDEGYGLTSPLISSPLPQDMELLGVLDGLDGLKHSSDGWATRIGVDPFTLSHIQWRTTYTLTAPNRLTEALENLASTFQIPLSAGQTSAQKWSPPSLSLEEAPFDVLSLLLDAREARELDQQQTHPLFHQLDATAFVNNAARWHTFHQDQPEESLRLLLRGNLWLTEADRIPIPPTLIERLGARRAAEIALDEGEMLALRLPAHALYLFDLARAGFQQSDDNTGQFITGICIALIHAHLYQAEQLAQALTTISQTYDFAHFVSWETLAQNTQNIDPDQLFAPAQLIWRPWLLRLLACIIWNNWDSQRPVRMTQLRTWLEAHYGAHLASGDIVLPADFDGWLLPSPPPQEADRLIEYAGAPSGKTIEEQLVTIPDTGIDDSEEVSSATPTQSAVRLEVKGTGRFALRGFNARSMLSSMQTSILDIELFPLRPYRQEAARTGLLNLLQHLPDTNSLTIEVSTDEVASAICWEALVAFALGLSSVPCYRTVPSRKIRPVTPLESVSNVLAVADNLRQQSLLSIAWSEIVSASDFSFTTALTEDLLSPRSVYKADVLHLVADVRASSGTVFLDIGDSQSITKQKRQSRQTRGGGLRSEDLLHKTPSGPAICLLQAQPALLTTRTETDRENAAYQRLFAAELHEHGVPVVFTIPPLPDANAAYVPGLFASAIRKHVLRTPALLKVITEARLAIIKDMLFNGAPQDDALETAFDLCLYLAPDRHNL